MRSIKSWYESPALAAAAASSVSGVRYGFGFTSMMKGAPV